MNAKYPFVMFYFTSFIICATDKANIQNAMAAILDEVGRHSWKLTIPLP